ncbi:hypothetical protein DUI87_35378 [Hirundo rustica rustica]|uniref:Junctional adhesion molecule A n=1 Tax=Hirundo rustica rustica TaxID=333673 RepID=A0A3M0J0V9_HIRRU|nr:hypothetical protein DUI87_35378 [Hirundo rustica rustica]
MTPEFQSKGGILSKACDYIQELRQSNLRLSEELQGLDQLQMDNEVLRQQVEELKNKNLQLRVWVTGVTGLDWGIFWGAGGSFWAALAGAQVTSEDREVPEHKPVDIPCAAFRSGSSPRIEWKFQRGSSLVLIYYGGQLTEPYRDRVQFSRTSIRFQSVTREDSGKYICEVVGDGSSIAKSEVNLIVQVPPGKPLAHVPSSATVGSRAVLRCSESQGSPPPTFRWYKDGTELPRDPKASAAFRNSSYSLDPSTGELVFEPVGGWDTGDYHCEASNNVGSPQKSDVFRMEASEVNVGGIVAAVVLLLLVLGLAGFGIWFAYSRGYFSSEGLGMDWEGLGGTGMDWEWTGNGLGGTGRDWEGLGGTGTGLGWTGTDWEGLGWTGRDWDGLGQTGNGLGMDWDRLGGTGNGLGQTGRDWEGLGGTGTGLGMDWEGLGGTGNGQGQTGRDWEWTGRDWEWTGRDWEWTGNELGMD